MSVVGTLSEGTGIGLLFMCIPICFPVLLKYDWHTAVYKVKVYNVIL